MHDSAAASTDDFVRFCCGDPDCPNDCERETPPAKEPPSAATVDWSPCQWFQSRCRFCKQKNPISNRSCWSCGKNLP